MVKLPEQGLNRLNIWLVPIFPAIIMIRAGQGKWGGGVIKNIGLL